MNEPEWQSRNGLTSQAGMLATGAALANAIHQNSSALVTVGNAQIQVPPTATPVPATATAVPPTATSVPPTATAVPTQVPPTAVPGPVSPTIWTLRSAPSVTSVARGSSIWLNSTVTADHTTAGLVDVEIYDSNWNKVYQRFWDSQSFSANVTRTFSTSWTVPAGVATSTYHVMVGTFGPGWNGVYSFNNSAATFTVR